jgi:predicted N-acetyltransferase YhbS
MTISKASRSATGPGLMAAPRGGPTVAEVTLRDAGTADHATVRAVITAAYRQYQVAMPPGAFEVYLADLLDLDHRANSGSVIVAERAGRVVGTVTYYDNAAIQGLGWPSGWAGLRALAVDPAARGLGIGRRLMQECFRRAHAASAPVRRQRSQPPPPRPAGCLARRGTCQRQATPARRSSLSKSKEGTPSQAVSRSWVVPGSLPGGRVGSRTQVGST